MPEALFIAVVLAYASGYTVSLYALSVYVDPDDVSSLMTGSGKRRQNRLRLLTKDPRTLTQVAAIYSAVMLIVITASGLRLMEFIAAQWALRPLLVYLPGLMLIWLLYVLLIEYLPRRRSRRFLRQGKLRLLWLVVAVFHLLSPLARFYRDSMDRVARSEPVTEEEKEEIIERAIESLADKAGITETLVEEDEKEMIGHIFQLDQTQVQEIMVPRISITGIEKRTSFADIQTLVRSDGHSRFPVYEETIDHIVGILYVKDLFSNMPLPGQEFVIASYLRKPFFIPESKVIGDLLREFRARQLHIAIVIDEYGGVAGLVTLEDILEEIVGEIQDEHDSEAAELVGGDDGSLLVDAALRVEKLLDHLDREYDHEETDTVGGLIYDIIGSVPREGVHAHWHDLDFEVLRVEGQRIRAVRVRAIGHPSHGSR